MGNLRSVILLKNNKSDHAKKKTSLFEKTLKKMAIEGREKMALWALALIALAIGIISMFVKPAASPVPAVPAAATVTTSIGSGTLVTDNTLGFIEQPWMELPVTWDDTAIKYKFKVVRRGNLLGFVGGVFNLQRTLPSRDKIEIGKLVNPLLEMGKESLYLGCMEYYSNGALGYITIYPTGSIYVSNRSAVDWVNPSIYLSSPVGPIAGIDLI